MLAVMGTICVVVVVVVTVVVLLIVRRRRAKKKSSPLPGQTLRRSALSTRSGVRGSRVRQNGEFGMYICPFNSYKRMDVM